MWTKIATAIVPKLIVDAYDYVMAKYQEDEEEQKPVPKRKKKDTTKLTTDQLVFIREMYLKWKLTNYSAIGSLKVNTQKEFVSHINYLLGTEKGVTAIMDVVYLRKQYKDGL